MPPENDNKVGYGKPPKHSQFKKGQSGNPRGRARGTKNSSTLFNEALDEEVVMTTENGRRRKITKREAMFKQLANRSAQGDLKVMQTVLRHLPELERHTKPQKAPETPAAPRRSHVLVLPDNNRQPRDPEEIAAMLRVQDYFAAKREREQQRQNPANENDEDVPEEHSSAA
jgi:hypothetical protein